MHPLTFRRLGLLAPLATIAAAFPLTVAATASAPEPASAIQSIKVVQTAPPSIPIGTQGEIPSTGEVVVLMNVEADGRLADWLIVRYSHEAYSRAAVDALTTWRFEPARMNDQAVNARTFLTIAFEARGRVVSAIPYHTIGNFIEELVPTSAVNRLASAQELDEPLRIVEHVEPRFPRAMLGAGTRAAAVVLDFFVDERGVPRMPVVLGEADPRCAEAAAEALLQWRFSIPRRHGTPAIVRVQQEFVLASPAGLES